MSRPNGAERLLQARRLMHSEGLSGVTSRLFTRAAKALNPPGYGTVPIDREHLVRAAEIARGGWQLPDPLPWAPGDRSLYVRITRGQ